MQHHKNKLTRIRTGILFCLMAVLVSIIMPYQALAVSTALTPSPKVTFTFDDGLVSSILAAQTLQQYGFTGTNYIISQCVGVKSPGICAGDSDKDYMTWEDIAMLRDVYKWNIGSHSATHPYLASTGDGEQEMLTTEQIRAELANSKADLAAHGYDVVDFAAPYGDYNNVVLAEAAKLYTTFRGFHDINPNLWPYNDRLVQNYQVQDTDGESTQQTVDRIKSYIDTAIAQNQWVTLTFHTITEGASSGDPDDYQFPASGLASIAEYVKSKNIPVVSPHDAVVSDTNNLLGDGSFDTQLSTDYKNPGTTNLWTTDETTGTLVYQDSANNGSLISGRSTSTVNSIRIAAAGANAHIWAPKVAVDPASTYVVKGYFNILTMTGGEVAYFIDEYDAAGAIVSTKYSSAVRYDANVNAIRVKNANFTYTPSSSSIVAARLYIVVQGNSGITGYMDNVEMFSPHGAIPDPDPVDPTPAVLGDLDGNGLVDDDDATVLFANWGVAADQTETVLGDINNDGTVNDDDATVLFANWSK